MGDNCIQVANTFVNKVSDIDKQNLKINAENKKAEEKHKSDMADYETQQRAVRKQDTGNVANCGTLPDASDVWTLDSWNVPCWACNFACSYKYTDVQIKRLMDAWKLKNPFIPKKQIQQPKPPNLQCCNNIINLANSIMSKDSLENIKQSCDQSINNNNGGGNNNGSGNNNGGGNSNGGGSQNNDPNSNYNTTGTQIDNSSTKKIIIGIIILVFVLVPVIIGIIFFLTNNNKKITIRKKNLVFRPRPLNPVSNTTLKK